MVGALPRSAMALVPALWGAIAALGAYALWRAKRLPPVGKASLAVVTLALLWPRLKDCTFLTFVPPAAWLGSHYAFALALWAALVVLLLSH